VLVKHLIQPGVERMCGTARQVAHRRLLRGRFRVPIAIADRVERAIDRVDP
jgi:hypothetical protein